jgi:uncharacterized membrane protein
MNPIDERNHQEVEEIIEEEEAQIKVSIKDRAADVVSEFGGSWTFIILFILFFFTWIAVNLTVYRFDNYPFILLNLILSCIAVFQAPFILMTQNRMADIDRKRAENDYKVGLLAEIEIRDLHAKMDKIIQGLSHEPSRREKPLETAD